MEPDQHLSCLNRVSSPAISITGFLTNSVLRMLYTTKYCTKREQSVAEYIRVHFAKRSVFENVNNHSVKPVYLEIVAILGGRVGAYLFSSG